MSLLWRLVDQEFLSFDFYGSEYEYAYSKQTAQPFIQRDYLRQLMADAIDYYESIPPEHRSFERAKTRFVGQTPL